MEGKVVLVTGATGGIGRVIVQNLIEVKHVAKVHAVCINGPGLLQLHTEYPNHVTPHHQDLTNWSATESLIRSITGPIHALVNNAGIPGEALPLGSITEPSIDKVHDLNVKAVINVSQLVAHKMKADAIRGSIVNLSSQASHTALQDRMIYCATKAAVDAVTRVSALELGKFGIRVNSVQPTLTRTAMALNVWEKEKDKLGNLLDRIPLGKMAEVQEVVNAVLFLLDNDQSSMISGVHLPVDGGFSIS